MTEKIDQWAIVELFGHQQIAGKLSEQTIGGCSFVRIDVPGNDRCQEFTKLFGQGAIYAITFVDEETANGAAKTFLKKPVDAWSARKMLGMQDNSTSKRMFTGPEFDDDEIPI